jgi:UDP-arabinose 4-epimerase
LATGGAGFVGSHVCKLLVRNGYEPITYDNLSRGHFSLARYGPLIRGDLHDRAALRGVITEVPPVACLHFAAFAYVSESVAAPALYYRNNVDLALKRLELNAARTVWTPRRTQRAALTKVIL